MKKNSKNIFIELIRAFQLDYEKLIISILGDKDKVLYTYSFSSREEAEKALNEIWKEFIEYKLRNE